jgi:hypothetical protein
MQSCGSGVKNNRFGTSTGSHEIGHSLGLVHSNLGLMTPSEKDKNRSDEIKNSDLRDILRYPLKGKVNSENGNKAGKGFLIIQNQTYTQGEDQCKITCEIPTNKKNLKKGKFN